MSDLIQQLFGLDLARVFVGERRITKTNIRKQQNTGNYLEHLEFLFDLERFEGIQHILELLLIVDAIGHDVLRLQERVGEWVG